jgi:hypothetical protein
MEINNLQKMILKALFKADKGLEIFTLYVRFNVSPVNIIYEIDRLQKLELINKSDYKIILSDTGRGLLMNNKIRLDINERPWRECPDNLKIKNIEINEPYMPNMKLLGSDIINK